jgi:adenine-specific DNA-methyltransferase
VLEPGCGDGSFLRSICNNLENSSVRTKFSIDAVELLHEEAEKSRQVATELEKKGVQVRIIEADFLEWITNKPSTITWDAIVGNPPYIRYQYFDKKQREFAAQIFANANIRFTKLTNAWVPFVIACMMHLSPGGRLAMVLPAELLHVLYADGLRRLFEQEMDIVEIIDVRELAFKDVLQGIVLLRAIKKNRDFIPLQITNKYGAKQLLLDDINRIKFTNNPATFYIHRLGSIQNLGSLEEINYNNNKLKILPQGKWTRWLLEQEELNLLRNIESESWVSPFVNIASVDIGIVTGANKYFVIDVKTANKYELMDYVSPMLARSEFIKGITYTYQDQKQNEVDGKAVLFIKLPNKKKKDLPEKVVEYINLGEEQEIHNRYKCRIRNPWYVVPYIWISEISLLKRCHDFPRLVLNKARALSTDTAYRIIMNDEFRGCEKDFVFSFFNSLTLLSAELEGRHYGGGVLELVPSEIESLRIPLTKVTEEQFSELDRLVRLGASVEEILDYTDPIVLRNGKKNKLDNNALKILRQARNRLRNRRLRNGQEVEI